MADDSGDETFSKTPVEGEEGAKATEDFSFDPSLKKKKKKKSVAFDEDPLAEGAAGGDGDQPADDDPDAMFADLKKKKKKKPIILDFEGEGSSGAATPIEGDGAGDGAAEDFDFGGLKKKKKKTSKKAAFDLEAFEKELGEGGTSTPRSGDEDFEDGGDDIFDRGDTQGTEVEGSNEEAWLGSDRDYTYPELLGRFFKILRAQNPELAGEKRRYTIAPPQVHREGNKKSIFANIADICKRMHRQPEHVIQFLFAELGTSGSVDGSQRLVIKGRFQQKQLENVLRRYIIEYVSCRTCKSPDTLLTKENRIYFMTCESCGSRRSVSPIKTGSQGHVKRKKVTGSAG